MNWCQSCGEQYAGPHHNCGYARISKDRLRELEEAERQLTAQPPSSPKPDVRAA